jgi:hypothetical protein
MARAEGARKKIFFDVIHKNILYGSTQNIKENINNNTSQSASFARAFGARMKDYTK